MKLLTLITLLFSLPLQFSIIRYNYSYYGDVIHSAPGMTFATYFNEQTLGVDFNSPEDIVEYDGLLYMVASSSKNLVVINEEFNVVLAEKLVTSMKEETFFNEETEQNETREVEVTETVTYKMNFNKFSINEAGFTSVRQFLLNNETYLQTVKETVAQDLGITVEEVTEGQINAYMNEFLKTYELPLVKPEGLDINKTGIYIADTGNKAIIKLNHNFEVVDVFFNIDNVLFSKIDFEPRKLTIDSTGRMYVAAKGVYEGIIELDTDGSFNRFTGVNPIKLSPIDMFNRMFMSQEQIDKLPKFLSTEYTNVTMNEKNFIYATALPSTNNSDNMIQLINPKGIDILNRNGYHVPKGDIEFVEGMNKYVIDGPSQLVDVAIYKDGIYTVLDQKRSRLFTYDSEGNLLYVNGDAGSQSDKFSEGVAITYYQDNLLVVDRRLRTVVVYQHTEFGSKVNEAIYHHELGEFEAAAKIWEEVLVLNTNYEVAYSGIGKFYLRNGEYEKAVEYFELGHNIYYYSVAFKEYRNAIIKENFGYIFAAVIIIPAGLFTYKFIKNRKGRKHDEE